MTRILRISADFRVFPVDFLLFLFCSSFFQKLDPRVSAQSASSAFYDLAFSDTLLEFLGGMKNPPSPLFKGSIKLLKNLEQKKIRRGFAHKKKT